MLIENKATYPFAKLATYCNTIREENPNLRKILARWKKNLEPYRKILKAKQPILAYSGGKDSTLLLFLYQYLCEEGFSQRPIIYHLQHNIRKNEWEENQIKDFLTQSLDSDWNIKFYSRNIPRLAKILGSGLEETGRKIRYHHLRKLATKNIGYIVTGHHSKDYLESVLIHWIRGGGQNAIQTLPVWNGSIFRPLLLLSDPDLHTLWEKVMDRLPIWKDESNEDSKYLRNRIRKNIISELEAMGLNFEKLRKNMAFELEDEPMDFSDTPLPSLFMIPESVINQLVTIWDWKQLLEIYLRKFHFSPLTRVRVSEIMLQYNRTKKIYFSSSEYTLEKQTVGSLYLIPQNSPLARPAKFQIQENGIHVQWNQKEIFWDWDGLGILNPKDRENVIIRSAEPGEKILERGQSKEISELFRAKRIPRIARKNFPILVQNKRAFRILWEFFSETEIQ
jgi:tRNA(Ile)-lysidine synthase